MTAYEKLAAEAEAIRNKNAGGNSRYDKLVAEQRKVTEKKQLDKMNFGSAAASISRTSADAAAIATQKKTGQMAATKAPIPTVSSLRLPENPVAVAIQKKVAETVKARAAVPTVKTDPAADMNVLQKIDYYKNKYNPLALGDMAINQAGAGAAQFGAAVADSVVAPLRGRGVNYPKAQTAAEAWSVKPAVPTTPVTKYINNARETLSLSRKARQNYYLSGNTVQDKSDAYSTKIADKYADLTDNDVTKALSDLASSAGYMIPVAVTNMIIPSSGTALLFAAGYSSGERQALKAGGTAAEASAYAYLNGLNQSVGEMLIGGVLGKGEGAIDSLLKKVGVDLTAKIANPTIKAWADYAVSIFGEGAEEVVQGVADIAMQKTTYNPAAKLNAGDLAYQGLLGGALGGVFDSGKLITDIKTGLTLPSVNTQPRIANTQQTVTDTPQSTINAPLQLPHVKQNAPQTAQATTQTFADRNAADVTAIANKLQTGLRNAAGDETLTRYNVAKTETERTGAIYNADVESVNTASKIATAGGLDIRYYRQEASGGTLQNGFTKDGVLYLNAASKQAAPQIIAHELTHNLENAKAYTALSEYVIGKLDPQTLAQMRTDTVNLYKAVDQNFTEADADREIVSQYAESKLFTDEVAVMEVVRTDRTVGEKIHTWLSGMVTKLTGTSEEKYLLRAKELYSKALAQTRNTEKTIASQPVLAYNVTGGVRMSISKADDTAYLDAVTRGDTKAAQRMVNKAAKEVNSQIQKPKIQGDTLSYLLQMVDMYGAEDADNRPRVETYRDIVKDLKSKGINNIDAYHVTDAVREDFDKSGIKGSALSYIGYKNGNLRDESVYLFLDPADIDLGYPGITGAAKSTSNVMHIEIPVERIKDLRWDSNFNVTFDTYSGVRLVGDAPSKWIKNDYLYVPKLSPAVTYDDNGNVIPLSKRFDSGNSDIRYSISKVDTEGNILTGKQKEFYKDSYAKQDEKLDGKMVVVYHGTAEQFTVFDKGQLGRNTDAPSAKKALFFTNDKKVAQGYAKMAVPQSIDALRAEMDKAYNKSTRITNTPEERKSADDAFNKAKTAYGNALYEHYQSSEANGIVMPLYLDIKNPLIHDYEGKEYREVSFNKLLKEASDNGNDGVIFKNVHDEVGMDYSAVSDVYAVFVENQAKSVDNKSPTTSTDIRYSVTPDTAEAEVAAKKDITERLRSIVAGIDAKYVKQSEAATQETRQKLDVIISAENARSFAEPGTDGEVYTPTEAETKADTSEILRSLVAEANSKTKLSDADQAQIAEEHAKIVLLTEAEALLKTGDPINKQFDTYNKAKQDYRAAVYAQRADPSSMSETDLLHYASKVEDIRNGILRKLEIRDVNVSESVKNGTFSETMQKQWNKVKSLTKEHNRALRSGDTDMIAKSKAKLDAAKAYISDINRRRKALLYKEAATAVGDITLWKDKKLGILYQRETLERNIRDIAPNKTTAENVNQSYRRPIDINEAARNKYKIDYRDKVRALNISKKEQGKNLNTERYAVQFVGEYDYNVSASKPNQKDAYGKTRSDYEAELNTFIANNPDINLTEVRRKAAVMSGMYNEIFATINKTLVDNGYPPVDSRKGYFPHFSENKPDTLLGKLAMKFGINAAPDSLPTSINGLTYQFKPGKRWFGNLLQRTGDKTEYDAVRGFDRYIEGASDIIHHTADIQRLRALAEHIRTAGSDEKLQDQAKKIRADDTKNAEQQHEAVSALFNDTKHALSNFVVDLDEYTNQLAGKKARADRETEYALGRGMYNLMRDIEGQAAGNMVAMNPRSWATQYIPIHQAAAQISNKNMIYGSLATLKTMIQDDGIGDASSFLVNRRSSDPLVKTIMQGFKQAVSAPMSWIDNFAASTIVRGRFYDNLAKGLSHEVALDEADSFAAAVMAGRSKGNLPTMFGAKNPAIKLFTTFQLEVNNQLSYLFKDLPREQKDKGVAYLAMALMKFFVGAYLFNDLFEWLLGDRPALDVMGVANDTVGDVTGYKLPNAFELGAQLLKGGRLPSVNDLKTEQKPLKNAGANLATNITEQLPFVGGLIGGGRIPISSALPNPVNIWNAGAGYLQGTTPGNKAAFTIGKELSNPLYYILFPVGGGQVKKVYEGIKSVNKSGSWTMDTSGNDILQYPIHSGSTGEKVLNYARSTVFGKSTLPTANDWVEGGFKNLSKSASETYAALVGMGADSRKTYNVLTDLASTKKTDEESQAALQRQKLQAAPISASMKVEMYYKMLTDENSTDRKIIDELKNANLSDAGIFDTIIKYKDLNISDAKAGEKALDWQHWVDGQNFTDKQKTIIDEYIAFRVALPVEPTTYEKFTTAGMNTDTAYKIAGTLSDLVPFEGKKAVSDMQKYSAIVKSELPSADKMIAIKTIMSETGYMTLFKTVAKGVKLEYYVKYLEGVHDIVSDMKDGKSVSDSKKLKVMTYINGMLLTRAQKDALYLAAGYAEDTISDAPWRGGESYSGDVHSQKLNNVVFKKK